MAAEPLKFAAEISFADGEFVDLGWHETQVGVLPLVHIRGNAIRSLGTCFSITNDGLCLTARHVIEEGVRLIGEPRRVDLDADEHGFFGALYVSSDPHEDGPDHIVGGLLPMYRVHFCGDLDIALIKLTLPVNTQTGETLRFPAHRLRLSLPGVGEPFFGLGYRAMTWSADAKRGIQEVSQTYSATRGEVEEIHTGGRDRAMLPFPCFRNSARLDGGMSGGPLIDFKGRVLGVVCSSFGTESEADYISYGSLVGPAIAMTLDVRDLDGTERKAFLWELIEGGAVDADTRGIAVERTGDDLKLTMGQGLTLNARLNA